MNRNSSVYRSEFKEKRRVIRKILDSISVAACELAYDEALNIKDFESAHKIAKQIIRYWQIKNTNQKELWKRRIVDSFEEFVNNDPFELILFHWDELSNDSTYGKDNSFYGFDQIIESISSQLTRDEYSELLGQLLNESYISSTSTQNAFLETKINGKKIEFYDPILSRRIAKDKIFCDTFSGYLHEPDNWSAENVWVECDTITNKLDKTSGLKEYRKIAKKSLFWNIKSRLKTNANTR